MASTIALVASRASFSENYSTWKLDDMNRWVRSIKDADGKYLVNFQEHFIEKFNRA